ncbi:hypothetical protein [Mycolicibacterium litorale]|nr:hypothetical protein [Mycolicibacterium litorale]
MGPPPPKGSKGKWIVGGVIMLLVVALAVTVTILVTRDGSEGNSPTPPGDGQASEFASANDTGPVNIITEDPTCDAWGKVAREFGEVIDSVNWQARDKTTAATEWTSEQKSAYDSFGRAMATAADDAANLGAQTPHRVVRELYLQFTAYGRAFVERIPGYVSSDDNLATVATESGNSISNICGAITNQSASAVEPLLQSSAPPSEADPAIQSDDAMFMNVPSTVCADWEAAAVKFDADTTQWRTLDPNLSATEWSPEEQAINRAAASVMNTNADSLEQMGRRSKNRILEDFAVLAAQYRRGFAKAIPTYTVADNYLAETASSLVKTVSFACKASQ